MSLCRYFDLVQSNLKSNAMHMPCLIQVEENCSGVRDLFTSSLPILGRLLPMLDQVAKWSTKSHIGICWGVSSDLVFFCRNWHACMDPWQVRLSANPTASGNQTITLGDQISTGRSQTWSAISLRPYFWGGGEQKPGSYYANETQDCPAPCSQKQASLIRHGPTWSQTDNPWWQSTSHSHIITINLTLISI